MNKAMKSITASNVTGYKIVSCCDPGILGGLVVAALEPGWVLHGDPFACGDRCCQAVVREKA